MILTVLLLITTSPVCSLLDWTRLGTNLLSLKTDFQQELPVSFNQKKKKKSQQELCPEQNGCSAICIADSDTTKTTYMNEILN